MSTSNSRHPRPVYCTLVEPPSLITVILSCAYKERVRTRSRDTISIPCQKEGVGYLHPQMGRNKRTGPRGSVTVGGEVPQVRNRPESDAREEHPAIRGPARCSRDQSPLHVWAKRECWTGGRCCRATAPWDDGHFAEVSLWGHNLLSRGMVRHTASGTAAVVTQGWPPPGGCPWRKQSAQRTAPETGSATGKGG